MEQLFNNGQWMVTISIGVVCGLIYWNARVGTKNGKKIDDRFQLLAVIIFIVYIFTTLSK